MKMSILGALAAALAFAAPANAQQTPPDDPRVIAVRQAIDQLDDLVQRPPCDQTPEPARWLNAGTPDNGLANPLISAHRGALTLAPENTLQSYEYAVRVRRRPRRGRHPADQGRQVRRAARRHRRPHDQRHRPHRRPHLRRGPRAQRRRLRALEGQRVRPRAGRQRRGGPAAGQARRRRARARHQGLGDRGGQARRARPELRPGRGVDLQHRRPADPDRRARRAADLQPRHAGSRRT